MLKPAIIRDWAGGDRCDPTDTPVNKIKYVSVTDPLKEFLEGNRKSYSIKVFTTKLDHRRSRSGIRVSAEVNPTVVYLPAVKG